MVDRICSSINENNQHDSNKVSLDESGIHLHCLECYNTSCHQHPNCPVIHCANNCGSKYHACKGDEHQNVCTKRIRACVNASNGCPFKLDSIGMMTHLEYCPASVVVCGMSWNRYPLYSKMREHWLPFWQLEGNPVLVAGDLDTEFAISDQKYLNREMKARIKKGAKMVPRKNVSCIDRTRIEKLQELISGGHCETRDHSIVSVSENLLNEQVENQFVDNEFVTYDELGTSDAVNIQTIVSSTNAKSDFYDLPSNYREGKYLLAHPLAIRQCESSDLPLVDEDDSVQTKEQRKKCLSIYSKLKFAGFPLSLNLTIETMPKFQNQYPMYSFSCSKVFRRDQYSWHCKNIHGDIQSALNGFMMDRCPMAYYGCPYTQFRLKPKDRTVVFSRLFSTFTACWNVAYPFCGKQKTTLLDLPFEILTYLISFLDNISLNYMAKTCHMLRDICYNILDYRGIILMTWVKKEYKDSGSSSWKKDKKMRFFTTASSPMTDWVYTCSSSIGNHLSACPFFVPKQLSKQVKLPAMDEIVGKVIRKVPGRQGAVVQTDYWQPRSPSDSEEEDF